MMKDEIERKFTEIDRERVVQRLKDVDADHLWTATLRSVCFTGDNLSDRDSDQGYLRVRARDDDVSVTYKAPLGDAELGREEIEFEASSFDEAVALFTRLGFEAQPVDVKQRSKWTVDDAEVVIDKRDGLPPYLEVEARTKEVVDHVAERLGFDADNGAQRSIIELHPEYFDNKH